MSHLDDDKQNTRKVSHIAQTEEGVRWAQSRGFEVVGTFEDLGVSAGKTTPFERPELGDWLSRVHEWDVLVFSKIDRAFRSTSDCVEFARWTKENRKILAFSGDGVVLDYLHPAGDSLDQMMSEFFIYVGSFFAAIELNRFKTRANDRLAVLRLTDRVTHGVPPMGYRTVPHPSGKGRALERDPEGYQILHEIYRKMVIEGFSLVAVVDWLNDTGVRTNRSRAINAKQPGKDGKWHVSTLKRTLTSLRLQGYRTTAKMVPSPAEGKPDRKKRVGESLVLDKEGKPVRMAQPTFSDEQWDSLQQTLAQRSIAGKRRQMDPSPLSGIAYCNCGYALALHRQYANNRTYTYVRCGNRCKGGWRLDDIEMLLDEEFLKSYGDREMMKQVFVPGENRSRELEMVEKSLERLRWESDNGLIDDEELYKSRMTALSASKRELSANTVIPSRYEEVGTGKTYRELWEDPDTDRKQLMRDARVRLVIWNVPRGSDAPFVRRFEFQDVHRPSQ